jgi:two-component system, NarL family, invasion response regulator UvrY
MDTVRVLLVDDQESFRRRAAAVVDATDGFLVAGCAGSGEEALDVAAAVRPQLVLMDVNLPGMDGLEATRRLRGLSAPPVVILLSGHDEEDVEAWARACGAAAYVAKVSFASERLESVWTGAAGLG